MTLFAKADCENCNGTGTWHDIVFDEERQCPCVTGEAMKGPRKGSTPHPDKDRARLDADRTAKPKTRIVSSPASSVNDMNSTTARTLWTPPGDTYVAEDGTRIPLTEHTPEELMAEKQRPSEATTFAELPRNGATSIWSWVRFDGVVTPVTGFDEKAYCLRFSDERQEWIDKNDPRIEHIRWTARKTNTVWPVSAEAPPDWLKLAHDFFDECEDPRLCREQAAAQLRDAFINVYALGMLAGVREGAKEREALVASHRRERDRHTVEEDKVPDELTPLAARIAKGRAKYANGCTVLSLIDETGEVAHAVNKYEPADRIRDELLDVAAVAMRLYFGEIDRGLEMDGLVQKRKADE